MYMGVVMTRALGCGSISNPNSRKRKIESWSFNHRTKVNTANETKKTSLYTKVNISLSLQECYFRRQCSVDGDRIN